jgi:AraC-like DNA-binding protein
LSGVSDLIEASGGDPAEIFKKAGMNHGEPRDSGAFIPYSGLARLMNTAAATLGRADFGLQLSQYQDFAMFGPVAVLIRNAETLEDALRGLIRYLHTYTPAVVAEITTSGETSSFTYRYRARRMPPTAQLTELTTAIVVDMMRRISNQDFVPLRAQMTHRQISSTEMYQRYFPFPLTFEARRNEIVFPSADLQRRIQGDNQAYALAEHYLGTQAYHDQVAEQARDVLLKLLPLGHADLKTVARALLLHPRTLQRRLQSEGTGFDDLLGTVRRSRAAELINSTDLPISMIASELGYVEQSSFARACTQWFGKPPSELRRSKTNAPWT